ncbi:hypothetical protein [Azospirillum sp. Marseille-Q6669]
MALLDDLVVQTALFPLVVGVAAVGVVRLAGGRTRGPRLAAAGVAAAFLAAYALIVGLPPCPRPPAWAACSGARWPVWSSASAPTSPGSTAAAAHGCSAPG